MTEKKEQYWQNEIAELDGRIIFLLICILQAWLVFIQEDIIGFRADFFELLEDIGETGVMYWLLRLMEIGGYLYIPLKIFIQIFSTSLMLWFGTFAFGYKAAFRPLMKISTIAYPVFFIQQILKILWFGFIDRNYDPFELDHFHNFSLLVFWPQDSRVGIVSELASWLNPGLIIYLWFLSLLLAKVLKRPLQISAFIVLTFIFGLGVMWKIFAYLVS